MELSKRWNNSAMRVSGYAQRASDLTTDDGWQGVQERHGVRNQEEPAESQNSGSLPKTDLSAAEQEEARARRGF